jgi:hypothetical protein
MTWILGSAPSFGYGALISDVRVSWSNGAKLDRLQKIYPIGAGLMAGFAGSVAVGFWMILLIQRQWGAEPGACLSGEVCGVALAQICAMVLSGEGSLVRKGSRLPNLPCWCISSDHARNPNSPPGAPRCMDNSRRTRTATRRTYNEFPTIDFRVERRGIPPKTVRLCVRLDTTGGDLSLSATALQMTGGSGEKSASTFYRVLFDTKQTGS